MIDVDGLVKSYGRKKALDGISMHIDRGEVVGFLGPNGAGKSTTMNILTGCISYTSGSVKIDGIDILDDPKEAKKRIGYLPEVPPLYTDMTVNEYLDFVYDLKKAKPRPKQKHIADICADTGLSQVCGRRIGNLSKGYRQRTGLAAAMIGDPDILILDEPTVGLDPQQIIEIRELIRELGKTRTVILSSHILSEVQAVCERVIIINNGKIVAEDTPENLAARMTRHDSMTLCVISDTDAAAAFAAADGIESVNNAGEAPYGAVRLEIKAKDRINAELFEKINAVARENGMTVTSLEEKTSSLEDVFISVTSGAGAAEKEEDVQ